MTPKKTPGCAFTLRGGEAIYFGRDGVDGLVMLFDGMEESHGIFLLAGNCSSPKLEVPFDKPGKNFYGDAEITVRPRKSKGDRLSVFLSYPDWTYFARRMNATDARRYFPGR